jgi:hypothetical protein
MHARARAQRCRQCVDRAVVRQCIAGRIGHGVETQKKAVALVNLVTAPDL